MNVADPATVVLTPGMAAVLRVLTGADAVFTVRQLARLADVSHARAADVVNRLAEHGLVLVEHHGPSKLCRLNGDHLAARAVIELTQMRSRLLELLGEVLGEWAIAPVHASLYGSAARGDGDTASDLDVLLVRPPGLEADDPGWADQLLSGGERLWRATGNRVAWFDVSEADLARAVRGGEPIVDQWRRDAMRLTGRDLRGLLREVA